MTSPGDSISTTHTRNIAITKVKRLRVIILNGRVMTFSIGFAKEFRKPRNRPVKNSVFSSSLRVIPGPGNMKKGPLNLTPGINSVASQRPIIPAIVLRISFNTLMIVSALAPKVNISELSVVSYGKPVGLVS